MGAKKLNPIRHQDQLQRKPGAENFDIWYALDKIPPQRKVRFEKMATMGLPRCFGMRWSLCHCGLPFEHLKAQVNYISLPTFCYWWMWNSKEIAGTLPTVGPPFPYYSHKNPLKYWNGMGPFAYGLYGFQGFHVSLGFEKSRDFSLMALHTALMMMMMMMMMMLMMVTINATWSKPLETNPSHSSLFSHPESKISLELSTRYQSSPNCGRATVNPIPQDPCMVYVPTFSWFLW